MKIAALGLALCLAIVAGSCTVNHLSDDFACSPDRKCSSDRTCVDGFCVLTPGDAGATCPAPCTSCAVAQKSCTIDCTLNAACSQSIVCPVGWSCNILCTAAGSCQNTINCVPGASCTITCGSALSCTSVLCGMGPCRVDCVGTASCRDVSCGTSCACDVICRTGAACSNLTCKEGCKLPKGCTSQGMACGC